MITRSFGTLLKSSSAAFAFTIIYIFFACLFTSCAGSASEYILDGLGLDEDVFNNIMTGNFDDDTIIPSHLTPKARAEYENMIDMQNDLSMPLDVPNTSAICSALSQAIQDQSPVVIGKLITPNFLLSVPNTDLPFAGLYKGARGLRSFLHRAKNYAALSSVETEVIGSSNSRDSCIIRIRVSGEFLDEAADRTTVSRPWLGISNNNSASGQGQGQDRSFENLDFRLILRSSLGKFVAGGLVGGIHGKKIVEKQRSGTALANALTFTRAMFATEPGSEEVENLVAPDATFTLEFPGRNPMIFSGPNAHQQFLDSLAVTQRYLGWDAEDTFIPRGPRSQECRTIFTSGTTVATGCVIEAVRTRKTTFRAIPTYSETTFTEDGLVSHSRLMILVNISLYDIGTRLEIEAECADLTRTCPGNTSGLPDSAPGTGPHITCSGNCPNRHGNDGTRQPRSCGNGRDNEVGDDIDDGDDGDDGDDDDACGENGENCFSNDGPCSNSSTCSAGTTITPMPIIENRTNHKSVNPVEPIKAIPVKPSHVKTSYRPAIS